MRFAALPPDVRKGCAFPQCAMCFAALPPDVRKGCAFPQCVFPFSGLRPVFWLVPVDLIEISFQRFIFHFAVLPIPRAGPAVINCSFNQSRSYRIHVDVVHFLHKDAFAKNLKDVCLVLPERVAMIALPLFVPQLFKRAFVVLFLQMLDHTMGDCAFDVAQDLRLACCAGCRSAGACDRT